jgi:hypothetical protein
MDCPKCGMASPPGTVTCDCGHDLAKPFVRAPGHTRQLILHWAIDVIVGLVLGSVGVSSVADIARYVLYDAPPRMHEGPIVSLLQLLGVIFFIYLLRVRREQALARKAMKEAKKN